MSSRFPNINTLWAHIVADELARCGLRHVVHAPGSRSTPLVVAFDRHPDITLHAVLDERCAGFFALGFAKARRDTVAVLCTSGTAAANFLPAVCEANLSEVPLLVLSADRPPHLRDSGAAQAMDQDRLYGQHTRWFAEVPEPTTEEETLRALRALACHAMQMSRDVPSGPVHLNFPFRKPLEPTPVAEGPGAIPASFDDDQSPALRGRNDGRSWVRYSSSISADESLADHIEDLLRLHARVLVVAGPDQNGADYRDALARFSGAAGVPVMAEALSQQRCTGTESPLLLVAAPMLARDPRYRVFARPGLVVRLGAAPSTQAMQAFVAEHDGVESLFISPSPKRRNPDQLSATQIHAAVQPLLEILARRFEQRPRSNADSAWNAKLATVDTTARRMLDLILDEPGEPFAGDAARRLGRALPARAALVVSSSMPVRDLDTYALGIGGSCAVYANRGVNGIDGVTSTALGIARARGGPTYLLTGDVAFLHDINALHIARSERVALTIVVVNNNGGEIFGMLPIRNFDPVFTKHFTMPHNTDIAAVTAAFGIPHVKPADWPAFEALISTPCAGTRVIEVPTDLGRSRAIRTRIHSKVMDAVSPLLDVATDCTTMASETLVLARTCLRRSSGPATPVVFLHGFTRSGRQWDGVAQVLSGSRTVYALDLPGHGASPGPADSAAYTMEAAAEGIRAGIERIGAQRVHLVGYSMGGRTALHFALAHPRCVASITLVSTSPGIADDAERAARAATDERLAAQMRESGLEVFLDSWSEQPALAPGSYTGGGGAEAARRDRSYSHVAGLAASLLGMGQGVQMPLWDRLPELQMPVLIVAGADDAKYRALASRMKDLCPESEVQLIEGAGHDVPGEAPAMLARTLDDFWTRVSDT